MAEAQNDAYSMAFIRTTLVKLGKMFFYFTSKALFVRSKHSLLMEFGQFMSYYKTKSFIEKLYKNCNLKTSFRPFYVCQEFSTNSI